MSLFIVMLNVISINVIAPAKTAVRSELVKLFEFVESIAAIGDNLRSFSRLSLPAKGVSIRMLQWLDVAR